MNNYQTENKRHHNRKRSRQFSIKMTNKGPLGARLRNGFLALLEETCRKILESEARTLKNKTVNS